jgi:hypothetical protein
MWAWSKGQAAEERSPVLAEVVEVPKRKAGAKGR